MLKKKQLSGLLPGSKSPSAASGRIPLWQALVLPVASLLVFFLLLEGGLALFGFKPALQTEDPFVGFASNAPLFVPVPGTNGGQVMTTASNKKDYFNRQSFPQEKGPGTFRIFCLGGSTTYGRPYDDTTSFAGWLREFLPAADRSREWEVINAGGISYASYRIAHLMEELVQYQPDLFIIYTGHNEFLEERTYRKLREIPPLVRSAASLLAQTRTWSAMSTGLQKLNIYPRADKEDRTNLAVEVDTILDQSVGPERYTRNDSLQQNILQHYRISLERMVLLARSVGAQVMFVTPASNLKDCSPFKSQHTEGLNKADIQRSEELLAMSTPFVFQKQWPLVLQFLDEAAPLDPRFAALHYRRGQALLGLGRFEEAIEALQLARDEDVCPLRALTPMRRIVAEVAMEQGAMLVDFVDLLQQRMQDTQGYAILGQEYFLDHVHPTIEAHKILAVALVNVLADNGLLQPGHDGWGEEAIAAVEAKIEGGINKETHGQALANLARVFLWAGKNEDAARLARQALDMAGESQQVIMNATSTMATAFMRDDQPKQALQQIYSSVAKAPGSVELRLKLGQILLDRRIRKLEEAAANLLLVTQLMPYYDWGHALFGIAMADRGRPVIAYPSLMQALRLNPNNSGARQKLAQIKPLLRGQESSPQPLFIQLDYYASAVPRKLVQGRRNASDFIPHGIEAEFYENGRLKRLTDYVEGVRHGIEITWDSDGGLIDRLVYRQGNPVDSQGVQ